MDNLENLENELNGLTGMAGNLNKATSGVFDDLPPEVMEAMSAEERKLINTSKSAFNLKGDISKKSEQLLKTLVKHGK